MELCLLVNQGLYYIRKLFFSSQTVLCLNIYVTINQTLAWLSHSYLTWIVSLLAVIPAGIPKPEVWLCLPSPDTQWPRTHCLLSSQPWLPLWQACRTAMRWPSMVATCCCQFCCSFLLFSATSQNPGLYPPSNSINSWGHSSTVDHNFFLKISVNFP